MAEIVLKDVCKSYGGEQNAVNNFNLTIKDEEFVILVGPSGCGKSTTLRMIAGLEDCTSGEIYIGEDLMNGVEPKDRNIAMVFQSYALYRHMTVYDNMAFSLKMKKIPKKEIDKRVRNIAEILGISHLLNRKPNALSGGECQRVALGRALVRNPKVFLFDEPLSNLDAKLRTAMREEIVRLHQDVQTTFVYVTHDQTEAMTMGDRIVVMDKGKIQQVDTPQEIYDHPANIFTAGFIGTPQMNFVDALLFPVSGGYVARIDGADIPLSPDAVSPDGSAEGMKVTLGFRPENLHIAASPDTRGYLGECTVEFIELLGASMNVHISVLGTKFVLTSPSDLGLKRGSVSGISADLDRIHVFDPGTGLAVTGSLRLGGRTAV